MIQLLESLLAHFMLISGGGCGKKGGEIREKRREYKQQEEEIVVDSWKQEERNKGEMQEITEKGTWDVF